MKKKYISLIFILACVLLSSCRIELSPIIKVSELLSAETKSVNGIISVEISDCNSYEDSRMPSDSLLEVQQKIKSIIPSAEYTQCYSKAMNSYAEFKIKMNVKNNLNIPSSGITVISDGKGALGLHIPSNIATRIKDSSFGENEVAMVVNIINDTENPVKLDVLSAFINNSPYPMGTELVLNPQQDASIRLSDVAGEYIMAGNSLLVLKPAKED